MSTKLAAPNTPVVDIAVASRPANIDAVPGLLEEIQQGLKSLNTDTDEPRKDLLVKCRALVQAIETPRETMVDHLWGQIGVISAVEFGVDCGLWVLMAQNGDQPQKVTDLAGSLGVDPELLRRLMRHISAMGLLVEVGEDEYGPTNYTKAWSLPQIGHGYLCLILKVSDH